MAQTGQQFTQSPFTQQQPVRGNYSRTEQNFYKGQSALNMRPEQAPYFQGQNQGNQYSGGMAALNYNAYSQK